MAEALLLTLMVLDSVARGLFTNSKVFELILKGVCGVGVDKALCPGPTGAS